MQYKLLKIDPVKKTILIEWEDGTTLNHAIPMSRLRRALPGKVRFKDRPGIKTIIDDIIKRERR